MVRKLMLLAGATSALGLATAAAAAPIVYTGARTITSANGTIAATYTIDTDGTTGSTIDAISHITGYSITLNDGVSQFTFGRTSTGGDSVYGSFTATATALSIGSNDGLNFNTNNQTAVGQYLGLLNFGSFFTQAQIADAAHTTYVSQFMFTGSNTIATAAPAAAVPEAATWATMILGMGAVGFAMRRRRVSTRVRWA